METLPDEILLMIFEHLESRDVLGSVIPVCRRWRDLVGQRVVSVQSGDDLERVQRLTRGLRVATHIPLFQEFLFLTPHVAPNLRELTIFAANPFKREHLESLYYIRHLQHLDIFLQDRLLDTELLPILLKLKSYVINEIVAPQVLRSLAASLKLCCLYMYGRSLYYPRKELHELLQRRRFHLRELTLRCTELNDASYVAIGRCEGLTSLQLYSCWLMTGSGIIHIAKPKKLRRLHITGARMVRNYALAVFTDRMPPLIEELNLSMTCFGDEHIPTLIRSLPKLRVLELWRCRITPRGIHILTDRLSELVSLDIDILLTNDHILQLDKHPSLLFLRCLTEYSMVNSSCGILHPDPLREKSRKLVTKKIKVIPTNERYPYRYFRGRGEGFRASLYYYWMQDVEMKPLAHDAVPAFNVEDDFY